MAATDKLDFVKLKDFYTAKGIIKKRYSLWNGRKSLLTVCASKRGLAKKKKLYNEKSKNSINKWANE